MSELKIYLFEAPVLFFNGLEINYDSLMDYKGVNHVIVKLSTKTKEKSINELIEFIGETYCRKITLSQLDSNDLVYLLVSREDILKFFPSMDKKNVNNIMKKNELENKKIYYDFDVKVKGERLLFSPNNLMRVLNSDLFNSFILNEYPKAIFKAISKNRAIISLEMDPFSDNDIENLSNCDFDDLEELKLKNQDDNFRRTSITELKNLKTLHLEFKLPYRRIGILTKNMRRMKNINYKDIFSSELKDCFEKALKEEEEFYKKIIENGEEYFYVEKMNDEQMNKTLSSFEIPKLENLYLKLNGEMEVLCDSFDSSNIYKTVSTFKNLKLLISEELPPLKDNNEIELLLKRLKSFGYRYASILKFMDGNENLEELTLSNSPLNLIRPVTTKIKVLNLKNCKTNKRLLIEYLIPLINKNKYIKKIDMTTTYGFYDKDLIMAFLKHPSITEVRMGDLIFKESDMEHFLEYVEYYRNLNKGVVFIDFKAFRNKGPNWFGIENSSSDFDDLILDDFNKEVKKLYKKLESGFKTMNFENDIKIDTKSNKFSMGKMVDDFKSYKMPQKVNEFEKVEVGNVVLFYSNGKWTTGKIISKPTLKFKNKMLKFILVQGITEFNVKGLKSVEEEFYSFTNDSIRCLMKVENGKLNKEQMKVVDDEEIVEYINK